VSEELVILKNMLPESKNIADEAEKYLLRYDQAPCPVFHHFSPGLYIREVNLPAGIFAVGHRQKTEHLNIFIKGRLSMINENGEVVEMQAPMIFTGKPGRKMGYIYEDVVWLNIYHTNETDVRKLEEMFIDKSEAWKDGQQVGLPKIIDQEDYKRVLEEMGVTEDEVQAVVLNEDDQIPFPNGSYSVVLGDSLRHGIGMFATADFSTGDIIAPARIEGKRTPAGRYTNHSKRPNAEAVPSGNDIYFVAKKPISGSCGGRLGDEITVDYRQVISVNIETLYGTVREAEVMV
jgi:hypothetical protein